ncbi:MAG: hypothetical protein ACC662_02125, partial [Planctomycetota bacterium]
MSRPLPSPLGRLRPRFAPPALLALLAVLVLAFAPRAGAEEPSTGPPTTEAPYEAPPTIPDETLDVLRGIAIQDGGRVKPLNTYANYALLRLNYKRSCETPDGRKLTPIAWLADVLFWPEAARRYECFRVETDEILDAIGLQRGNDKKKADRYSYAYLARGRKELKRLAREYSGIESKSRTRLQGELVNLFHAVREFEGILHYLDFARGRVSLEGAPAVRALFDGKKEAPLSAVITKTPDLIREARKSAREIGNDPSKQEGSALRQIETVLNRARYLAMQS